MDKRQKAKAAFWACIISAVTLVVLAATGTLSSTIAPWLGAVGWLLGLVSLLVFAIFRP